MICQPTLRRGRSQPQARTLLREAGRLGPDALRTHERAFAVGDRVIATRNDPRLGVVNGEAGSLSAFHDGRLYVELDSGRSVNLPETYVQAGHLDHAYATTAHRAQGTTVDRAFILGSDELYGEWGYTALSRRRDEARLYVTAGRRKLCAMATHRCASLKCSPRAAPNTSLWTARATRTVTSASDWACDGRAGLRGAAPRAARAHPR